jgi:hypothetical protein
MVALGVMAEVHPEQTPKPRLIELVVLNGNERGVIGGVPGLGWLPEDRLAVSIEIF